MILNKIQAVFGGAKIIKTAPIEWQYDQKQYLKVIGLVIPDYTVMDFCNVGDATTKSYAVVDNQVLIPDEYLRTGKDVEAYLVITGDDSSVQTRYKITIPVNKRPRRTDVAPTPAEQSQIDLLVVALNDGVTRSEAAALAAEGSAGRAETAARQARQAFTYADDGNGNITIAYAGGE